MTFSKKTIHKLTAPLLILMIGLIYACSSSTDPDIDPPTPDPDPEPPELPAGERVMLIEIIDQDEEPLTGYDIDISGPTSTSASNVSESVFTFDDLADGEYTIVVTLDDYIEGEITVEVELPEKSTSDMTIEHGVTLVQKAPPVVINNDEDNEIETAPSDDPDAEEDEKTVMRIPANSIPQDALDEDGNIQIRVTRSSPKEATTGEEGGTVTDNFTLEPDGLQLNNEIEIEIPINAVPGVNYVLQPGNIPLAAVTSKTVQRSGLSADSNHPRTITRLSAKITNFRRYRVVADITVEKQLFLSEPIRVGSDASCGENGQWTYTLPLIVNGDLNTLPEQASKILRGLKPFENESKSYNKSVNNNVPEFKIRLLAQNIGNNFRLIQNGEVIEEFTRNITAIFDPITVECHNSGGG